MSTVTKHLVLMALLAACALPILDGRSAFDLFCAQAAAKDGDSGGSGSSGSGHGSSGGSDDDGGGGDGGDDDGGKHGGVDGTDGGKGKRGRNDSVGRFLDVLKGHGQVARTSRSGSNIEVRYSDGWREAISGSRYRLYDKKDRRVIDRKARQDDYDRLLAVRR